MKLRNERVEGAHLESLINNKSEDRWATDCSADQWENRDSIFGKKTTVYFKLLPPTVLYIHLWELGLFEKHAVSSTQSQILLFSLHTFTKTQMTLLINVFPVNLHLPLHLIFI